MIKFWLLAPAAAALCPGAAPVFELSATNADKPPLAPAAALQRTAQFLARRLPLLLTVHVPTFVRKAPLLPRSVFVVGYGTRPAVAPSSS